MCQWSGKGRSGVDWRWWVGWGPNEFLQGRVTTPFTCDGTCNNILIANFLLSVAVNEFLTRKPCCRKETAR